VTNNFKSNSSQKRINSLSNQEGYAHAAPLAPLRERDWTEIALLFDRQDSDEIEADVISKLSMLHPEPCWDEDPYEFLSEFL
jgi:hypothetical protein